MGKRSNFKRRKSDKYFTPAAPVALLIPYISHIKTFIEPMAGDGRLVRHLQRHGLTCLDAFDLEPDDLFMRAGDALQQGYEHADAVISNPPWTRPLLHSLIVHFVETTQEAWLLFDADWHHTKQARPFMKWCTDIVTVGRVKWIEDSKGAGKDNACWYRFSADSDGTTIFHC